MGSILAVTTSDKHSIGKTTRFVGLCIDRGGAGLRAFFVLRNAIDNQGIEVKYDLYDPTIQKIELLLLEKRLDDKVSSLSVQYTEHRLKCLTTILNILTSSTTFAMHRLSTAPLMSIWKQNIIPKVSPFQSMISK